MRSFLRSAQVPFVVGLAGVLSLSLAGCGGSNTQVTHPTLTVTAANASRVYGAANPTFTASASGALPGDTFAFTSSTVATPSSPAGAYSIVPVATGANLANYNVVYVNGALTVDKATLTVTPNNQSIVAGSVLPSLSATITGFVNGDTQTAVTGQPALTTTAASSSPAGSYPIVATIGTLAAANYSFTFATGTLTVTPAASNPGVSFTGNANAGTQPVVAATVQLYAAGTSGNGSPGTGLLTNTLATDGAGAFTVPAGYACPAASSQLYVVVLGGHVGGGAPNPGIALASPIGACNQLTSGSQFVINEVTTAATAYGLAQFLSAGANIGATSTNTQGLRNAVATVASLANLTTGTSPGASFPQNASSPAAKINSVANLLNTCTSAALPSGCTALFSATTPAGGTAPSNTLDAALNLARNPGSNVAALYTQSTASTAFTPALTAAPSDWTMFLNYTGGGMNLPTAVGVDATGDVWVASYSGAASRFSPTGAPAFPNGITGGGLFHSYGLAIDPQNNVWIPNEDSPVSVNGGYGSVTALSATGQLISGPTGFTAGGIAYPIAVAIDTNSTVWVTDSHNSSVTLLSSTGQPLSGPTGYQWPQLAYSYGIAIDANHNGWAASNEDDTITKISPDGSQFTNYACCRGPAAVAIDQRGFVWVTNYLGDSISQLASDGTVISSGYSDGKASISHPQGIAIDGSGHVWVTNILGSSITELAGSATNSPGQILSPTAGWSRDAGLNYAYAVAIDASGNLWVVNKTTNILTEIIGLATPVKTPQLGPAQSP
ncbi:MAG TPA: MBG domain-containing protein [Edaphobacter sp.]|nr:MBG domain-containing protein [Edaphobacter sp.]